MAVFRERAADSLQERGSFRTSRIFTDEEVTLFAQMSKDYNPVHFNARNITSASTRTASSAALNCRPVMRSFRRNKGA